MGTVNVGDVVELRSGGPKMTVTCKGRAAARPGAVESETEIICQWFDDDRYAADIRCEEAAVNVVQAVGSEPGAKE